MYYFFRSWRDSLSLFIPQNAKLFSLVTLKTIINSYKKILKDLWWLLIAALVSEALYYRYFGTQSLFALVPAIAWLLFIFMAYLTVRPSINKKNLRYYVGYIPYFFYFLIMCILVALVPFYFKYISKVIADLALNSNRFYFFLYIPLMYIPLLFTFIMPEVLPVYLVPLFSFFMFFLLDSRGRISDLFKSLWRAIKLIAYNYPFCAIAYAILLGLGYLLKLGINWLFGPSTIYFSLAETLFAVIPLSIYVLFYTKRLHEQFTLYFPESVKE